MAAASVGDAKPNRMDPKTAAIINKGGTRFFVEIKTFSIKLGSPGSGGMRGPNSGLIRHKVKMYTKYKLAIIRPGNTIP